MKKLSYALLSVVFIMAVTVVGALSTFRSYASATELYVDDDWPASEDTDEDNDFSHIQAAIDAASNGDEIIVAQGTYYENISFNGKGITVTSTNPEDPDVTATTIIDGGQIRNVVTFNNDEGNGSVLCGFTVQNGKADIGAGIYCNYSSPTIKNCNICENSGSSGAGIYCEFSNAKIRNCTISGNISSNDGGGICSWSSSPEISNCTISNNEGGDDGGGIACRDNSSAKIDNSVISGNIAGDDGGGIWNSASSLDLHNCIIKDNTARCNYRGGGGGGLQLLGSTHTITNCVISGNKSFDDGGGIHGGAIPGTIINCTISGNIAADQGGGIYCSDSSSLAITNFISWNNLPTEIYVGSGTPIITYSNIQGGFTGEGNIDADPLFIDAANGDYHLFPTSPCIDTGDPDSTLSEDKDGNPRPLDGNGDSIALCDMGAYEFNPLIADLNKDGDVDGKDLAIFAAVFGYVE